jgi:hypothetical protein
MKNGQSRETGNIGYTRHKTKTKKHTQHNKLRYKYLVFGRDKSYIVKKTFWFYQKVHWNWYHQNARAFDWQYIYYVWWTCTFTLLSFSVPDNGQSRNASVVCTKLNIYLFNAERNREHAENSVRTILQRESPNSYAWERPIFLF